MIIRRPKLRLLLAEDHTVFRLSLINTIKHHWELTKVDQADSGSEALHYLESSDEPYDLMITEIYLRHAVRINFIEQALKIQPDIPIIALSRESDEGVIFETLKAGAKAYLLKTCASKNLYHAIEAVIASSKM